MDEDQEAPISWAAEKANWQLLRFSLGDLMEMMDTLLQQSLASHCALSTVTLGKEIPTKYSLTHPLILLG